jgi:hypothetical protein
MDMMYNHYMDGLTSIERMILKDIRILEHILTIQDPRERLAALNDAFTLSIEYETEEFDYLWTCVTFVDPSPFLLIIIIFLKE